METLSQQHTSRPGTPGRDVHLDQDSSDHDDVFLPAPPSWFEEDESDVGESNMNEKGQETTEAEGGTESDNDVQREIHRLDEAPRDSEVGENSDENVSAQKLMSSSQTQADGKLRADLPLQDHARSKSHVGNVLSRMDSVDERIPRRRARPTLSNSAPSPAVGVSLPSPSWKEISSQILPAAAKELLSSSLNRICYTARLSYVQHIRWQKKYSEIGNNAGGYSLPMARPLSDNDVVFQLPDHLPELPPFSSLPWVDRQLVQEWRTYRPEEDDVVLDGATEGMLATSKTAASESDDGEDDEHEGISDFDQARTLVPMPVARPHWQKAEVCYACRKTFGPTRLRHHCRLCGMSVCHPHSSFTHRLPHLGYDPDVPERVCDSCKRVLLEQNLAERVAWRLARCRDYDNGQLRPYFETGVETVEEAAMRLTQAALIMAKSIPLGAQATVAVETVDVLRRHGLNGIYTIMLRQEFLAAADLLRKALGINRTAWPLSVHELSAAIFYALAQHRAMRGMNPEHEHAIHSLREASVLPEETGVDVLGEAVEEGQIQFNDAVITDSNQKIERQNEGMLSLEPVCDAVPDSVLASVIFYAPMALNFVYCEKEVDIQLLAAQQGWRLLYAYLEQEVAHKNNDRPASALFVHGEQKIACLAVRGTSTIHDVITDIRQVPVPFPEREPDNGKTEDGWTTVFGGEGLAVCGMAGAAFNLYREHIDSLMFLARRGFRLRFVGHSLGGGVATLLGALVYRDLERELGITRDSPPVDSRPENGAPLRVYAYGTPSCVDAHLGDEVESFVTTVVLHDDVVPRLTPSSCRGLLKHLLHIRETWVKDHLPDDLMAITERAKTVWAPRWRGSFTLAKSSTKIKKFCKKQLQNGKEQILLVKEKLVGEECPDPNLCTGRRNALETVDERTEDYLVDQPPATGNDTASQDLTENLKGEEARGEFQRPLVDYMGALDGRTEAIVIDGDEFFDPNDKLVEDSESESTSSDGSNELFESIMEHENLDDKVSEPADGTATHESTDGLPDVFDELDEDSPGAVVLDEIPLPRMFIPGKVIHIYSHRGVYRATYVPRNFRELRRISMAGNMLSDHKTKEYYEALLEVRTVRSANESPPRWTAFDEDDTW